ncbi:hypothetical protein K438DRAFT_2110792 [Mycena galopus ATCC 62051]|nr:hypothetical protein K438DRAFT_2110792 [Mycena galopus ATCC 62051]
MALAGVSSGAAERGLVCYAWASGAPSCAALRGSWGCERLVPVAVAGGDDGGRGGAGPCEERVLASCMLVSRDRRGEEKNKVGWGWVDGRVVRGAQMRRSRVKAQAPRTRSKQWRESTVACAEEQGEEGRKTRARITKGSSKRVVEGKVAKRKKSEGSDGGTKEVWIMV